MKSIKIKIVGMVTALVMVTALLSGCVITSRPGGYCHWHRCWSRGHYRHHKHHRYRRHCRVNHRGVRHCR